jgi:hypothetical protein
MGDELQGDKGYKVTREEAPGSNSDKIASGSAKRSFKLWLVVGLGVIVLGLVGYWGFVVAHDAIADSVSVTFLGYTNRDAFGSVTDYRLAWFRIANKSRFKLVCTEGVVDIETSRGWFRENTSVWRVYNPPTLEPGQSATVSVIVPSEGTRWENRFLLTKVDKSASIALWRSKLLPLAVRLPAGSFKTRIMGWLLNQSDSRYVTSGKSCDGHVKVISWG